MLLLRSKFWARLWIAQEVIISVSKNSGVLLIGRHSIRLSALQQVANMLVLVLDRDLTAPWTIGLEGLMRDFIARLSILKSYAMLALTDANEELYHNHLLPLSRRLHVTDHKDGVYGFLAI